MARASTIQLYAGWHPFFGNVLFIEIADQVFFKKRFKTTIKAKMTRMRLISCQLIRTNPILKLPSKNSGMCLTRGPKACKVMFSSRIPMPRRKMMVENSQLGVLSRGLMVALKRISPKKNIMIKAMSTDGIKPRPIWVSKYQVK